MRRWWPIAFLIYSGCGPFRFTSPVPSNYRLVADTTGVIIRVFNYQVADVTMYLDTQQDRMRIGVVAPGHQALFVLPSAEVTTLRAFTLTAESVDPQVKPYRTGLISRNPAKITMVYLEVGQPRDTVPATDKMVT